MRTLPETKRVRFAILAEEARACNICPRMNARTAVLSELNGSLNPRVLFIAEAPGRQGADRTRIPFSGDASGRTFDKLLEVAGLTREDIFITNAVLCSPRSDSGANRAPTQAEVKNCIPFLARTILLLDAPIVVAIGGTALAALERIHPHGLSLGRDVGRHEEWDGRKLIPLYHPSPQVLISRRSLAQQMEDWGQLAALLAIQGH